MIVDTIALDDAQVAAPVRFANFGVRLGAAVIDALVTSPLIAAVFYFTMFNPDFTGYISMSVLALLYKPILEGTFGATVGKMATKIKVVGKENTPIDIPQAFMRATPWILAALLNIYFAYAIFQIPGIEEADGWMEFGKIVGEYQMANNTTSSQWIQQLAGWLPLLSALVMLGNKRRQSAHDILAETFVIHTQPKSSTYS